MGKVRFKSWQAAGLLKPSVIKPVVATIRRTLVLRKLGQLGEEDPIGLRQIIDALLG
jgi:mRNA interferase MazF